MSNAFNAFNELLAAAKKYRSEYCRDGDPCRATGHELETAIAAAEREAAELDEPIDEAWLYVTFRYNDDGATWWSVIGDKLISVERADMCEEDDTQPFAVSVGKKTQPRRERIEMLMNRRDQLLSLLKGLGIEVAK